MRAAALACNGVLRSLLRVACVLRARRAPQRCPSAALRRPQFLRKKGLASADKKAGRVAAEGAVWSYIHAGSRLGVLVEVNCETDFVARGDKFKELVSDIAMQVGAGSACCVRVCFECLGACSCVLQVAFEFKLPVLS